MKQRSLLLLLLLSLSSCHVGRFFVWNFADIRDYKKFPSQPVAASATPFYFKDGNAQTLRLPKYIHYKNDSLPFEDRIEKDGTVAFLIIRNDSILYEKYFNHYDSSDVVPSFSAAKSFVSALIGIAIDEGKIKSIHDPITNYLPELKDPGIKRSPLNTCCRCGRGLSSTSRM